MNYINRIGLKYGRLTVLGLSKTKPKESPYFWECICECGNIKDVAASALLTGNTRSCGCYRKEFQKENVKKYGFQKKDILGQRFGHLVVLERTTLRRSGNYFWKCRCDCGNIINFLGSVLVRGKAICCGRRCLDKKGLAAKHLTFIRYQKGAEERGISFEITEENFGIITQQNCYYCGDSPSNVASNSTCNGTYTYNGIDRVNNNLGYLPGNVVPCCFPCNQVKSVSTTEEFLNRVEKIYNYSILKGKNDITK